jgi:plasmid replication initiation protein
MSLKKKEKKRGSFIQLIVKSNNLVEARYMMDIWETRIFITLLSMITKDDEEDRVYRIWYNDVKKKFDLTSNTSYEDLRDGAMRLVDKTVHLDWTTEDNFDRLTKTHLVESVDVLKPGQGGKKDVDKQKFIDFQLGRSIKPHLLNIKKRLLSEQKVTGDYLQDLGISGYTSYDLRNLKKLKPYGVRLFEIMKKYEYTGYWVISVEALKNMFMIEDEYKRFPSFFQNVIQKSVKDINKYTDIFIFNVEKIKQGRSVARLKFYIRSKSQEELGKLLGNSQQEEKIADLQEVEEMQETEADRLYQEFEKVVVTDFGVTPTVFVRMLDSNKYTKEMVEQAIGVTRRAKYNQEIKKTVAGFFIKALKEGFTDIKAEQKKKEAKKKVEEENLNKRLEELEEKYATQKQERIKQLLNEDKGVSHRTLESIKKSKNPSLIKHLISLGLSIDSATVQDFREDKNLRSHFIQEIVNTHQDYFADIQEGYRKEVKGLKKMVV